MKKLFIFLLPLLFSTVHLFSSELSFKISPSLNGFDVFFSNNEEEDVIIASLIEECTLFRFCVITAEGISMSKQPPPRSSLSFYLSKSAFTIPGKTVEAIGFEKGWGHIPIEKYPFLLFGMFKKIRGGKMGFDFFGPILVIYDKAGKKPVFSFFNDKVPSEIQAQFGKEFKAFQAYQSPQQKLGSR